MALHCQTSRAVSLQPTASLRVGQIHSILQSIRQSAQRLPDSVMNELRLGGYRGPALKVCRLAETVHLRKAYIERKISDVSLDFGQAPHEHYDYMFVPILEL